MQNKSAIKDEFTAAGLSLMVLLYRGKPADRLNKLRHEMYYKLAATSLVRLPPH